MVKNLHYSGYKALFSHKGFVKQLLKTFVPLEWVKEINYEKIEKQNVTFVRGNYKHKESDIIYKLPYKDKEIYIYILIEFQSTVDKWMSLRMLSYIIDFYEEIIKREKVNKLPIIFPIIIYNGEEKWTAENEIRKIIKETDRETEKYIPKFEYYKIVINEIKEETLEKINNAISAMFLIEKAKSEAEIEKQIEKAVETIKEEIDKGMIEGFVNWLRRTFEEEINEEMEKKLENLKEVKPMLTSVIKNIKIKYREEGIEEGIKEGIKEGELLEIQNILIRLMDKKFGINDIEKQRIKSTKNKKMLDNAIENIIFAENKEKIMKMLIK